MGRTCTAMKSAPWSGITMCLGIDGRSPIAPVPRVKREQIRRPVSSTKAGYRNESDGRAMAARDGCGKMRTSRKRFGMSFRGKVNLWKSTWESCCSVPLLLVAAQFFSGALEIPYTHISNRLSNGFTAFFACFPLPLRLGALPVSSASNAFWKSSLVAA